jgi:hypothetical protein
MFDDCPIVEASMRYLSFSLAMIFSLFIASSAFACCSYGCCDCSCVSLKMQKLAPKLDSQAKGELQSFAVDTAISKGRKASWKCQMQAKVAMCEKQQ